MQFGAKLPLLSGAVVGSDADNVARYDKPGALDFKASGHVKGAANLL